MDESKINNNKNQEDTVDFRTYFQNILSIWYIFPISISLMLLIGYLYNARTPQLYKATSTLLIRKDIKTQNGSADEVINGFGLFDAQKKIENEIGILTSYSIAESTILNKKNYIRYYKLKKFRRDNIYTQSPFFVVIDSTHQQLTGCYKAIINSDNSISIEREKGPGMYYDYFNNKVISSTNSDHKVSIKTSFDNWTKNEDLNIKLIRNSNFGSISNLDNEIYYFELWDLASLSNYLKKAIVAESVNRQADIIGISLTHDNPIEATDILNSLVSQYFSDNLNEKNKTASMAIEFIDGQLEILSDSLFSTEHKLEVFRRENKVINVEIQSTGLFQSINNYESLKAMAFLKLKYFDYLKNYINTSSNYSDILVPSNIEINDPLLNKLISDLMIANAEKNKIQSNSTNKNPLLKNINKQIEDIKKGINESVNSLINTTNIEIKDIEQHLSINDKQLLKIPETERSLIGIQRSFAINNEIYTFLLQKRAESSIAQASTIPDGKLIDPARISSTKQIQPNKNPVLLFFFFIGLILPIIYIIIKKKIFNYIENKKDIEKMSQIPLIGTIPHSDYNTNYVILEYPQSFISESIRTIRTNLKFMSSEENSNVILITSSIPKEGKTFTCVNIASSFALSNKKTIILGLDLRNPGLFKEFKIDDKVGISTYLTNQSDFESTLIHTEIPNLDLMIAGPIPPNPSELIGSDKMKSLIQLLKEKYSYIIIDTPPIIYASDAIQLFSEVNIILYIVRQNYTRNILLENINSLYIQRKVKNIGFIFNDVKKSRNGYGYGYNYSYEYNNSKSNINGLKKLLNKLLKIIKK